MLNEAEKKKILGQFFSGVPLGELLMSLLHESKAFSSLIDPMAGIGDLLLAARSRVRRNGTIRGVEIDPEAAKTCAKRVSGASIENADAFQIPTLNVNGGYGAVVTNPPYVRYQLFKRFPGGSDIRNGLIRQIRRQGHLGDDAKELLLRLAEGYSGISDMAVPSWILCASILSNDGWLAIIVPETWMSRTYALPIQYMLFKLFEVRYIIRDVGACWFSDALVRTCLVVARRRPIRRMSAAASESVFCVDLYREAQGRGSLVGNLDLYGLKGDRAWAHLIATRSPSKTRKLSARAVCMRELFPALFAISKRPTWMDKDDFNDAGGAMSVHAEMASVLPPAAKVQWRLLHDYGLACSQGMRTGANDFFYLRKIAKERDDFLLRPSKWHAGDVALPCRFCIPALKKRCDVGSSFVVKSSSLKYVLLYLDRHVRASDIPVMAEGVRFARTESAAVDQYITEAEKKLDRKGTPVFDLSAVRTNERSRNGRFLCRWYQLPDLMERHCPNLCVPRVNGGVVQCLYVPQGPKQRVVVDANFTTLWGDARPTKIGLCLLNSLWFKCYSECVGSILGGGALKLEAAVIRKMVFPQYTKPQLCKLERLSEELQRVDGISATLQRKIDMAALAPFGDSAAGIYMRLYELLEKKLAERGGEI